MENCSLSPLPDNEGDIINNSISRERHELILQKELQKKGLMKRLSIIIWIFHLTKGESLFNLVRPYLRE